MTFDASERSPRMAIGLLLVVALCLLLQMGALISQVLADVGGGAGSTAVTPDVISDQVAATAAQFRVDESGAATYSIPLYAVPGTAGVAPQLALAYSSQGGYGPLGKGWALSGLSSVSRCRATREAGDFIVGGVATDGNPAPVNYTATDRYCLDGQRLIAAQAASAACPAIGGMSAQNLRTEIESFQRVCAYTPSGGTSGPAFFTVDRKDGSTSWYGDRDNDTTSTRPDGYFNSTAPGMEAFALSWAQTRFQDSNGNYIDFIYLENPAGAGAGEHLVSEVRYTGKTLLPGQVGSASAPYAKIQFNYSARPAAQWGQGYAAGGVLTQSRRLDSITSCAAGAAGACALASQARFYQLAYDVSASGSGLDTLTSLQECRDSSKAVCLPATTFDWSQARYEFATKQYPPSLPTGSARKFEGFKMGDVDGDGRQDIVYLKDGSDGESCPTESLYVLYAMMDAAGSLSYNQSSPICTPDELMTGRGDGSWKLLDYDGDGRDDLLISAQPGTGWRVYPSQGRNGSGNFDTSRNLLSSMAGIIPSYTTPNDQAQLADLNGDGLTDVVYPSAGQLKARLMERGRDGFGWGAERTLSVDIASLLPMDSRCGVVRNNGWICGRELAGAPTTKTGFMQLADFNGDAASDLLLQETQSGERYTGNLGCMPQLVGSSLAPTDTGDASQNDGTVLAYRPQAGGATAGVAALPSDDCYERFSTTTLYAMVVKSTTATTITIAAYADMPGDPYAINLADINGDGLTDIFYRPSSTEEWAYRVNTGTGMQAPVQLPLLDYEEQVRFADVNGDGRTDVLHVANPGMYKTYNVRYALPSGGFGPESWLPGVAGTNANALLCEGYRCEIGDKVPIFADLDGDGILDFMTIRLSDNADLYVSQTSARFVPRDVVVKITNGMGAQTQLSYAPLTNAAVYRRDAGTRDGANWGRGSAVQDMLAPSYVVWRASSSSPQAGDPAALVSVFYRYAGAKVQAGGRGFLGFREIVTTDNNQSGGYVTTQTTYSQNFPFVGMPLSTVKRALVGQTYAVPACLTATVSDACFATPGQPFPALTGASFSAGNQVWEADTDIGAATAGYSGAIQAPVQVRTAGTDENLFDPYNGVQTSRILTTFDYGAYGNVTITSVDTYTGSSALTSTLITANTYADNPTAWRLGRLSASTVTHRRPNRTDVVRTSAFTYSMSGPVTGQLIAERTQPNGVVDQDLRKEYDYDQFGNRTIAQTCADPATSCSSAIAFHPARPTTVQRYSRTQYDARGRFPVLTYEPFWNGAGAVEKITQAVVARNLFGDVTQAYDLNGRDTLAVTGSFGRAYYAWTETVPGSVPGAAGGGVESLTSYRWCGAGSAQVSCPTGARFREKTAADGAPNAWTYFDVLGRPILKVAASFNAGLDGKDAAAVCTTYDATGKPKQVSNPFFLAGTAGADPGGLDAVCTSGRTWTTTSYDLLGRPTDIQAPDGGITSTDYAGNQTILTDARGNATWQQRNGRGELIQVTDANGLVLSYWYQADGSNYLVSRDAGRGAVQNQFFFDALGRKIRQVDPDSGTTRFEYNALGEVVAQQDASGNRIENEIDARGRVWRRTVRQADGAVESQSSYTFDTAANGVGQLAGEAITGTYAGWVGQGGVALGYQRSLAYDSLGRALGSTTVIDGASYTAAVQYDAFGRAWKARDASGRWAKTVYNARGLVESVCNSSAADLAMVCPADANTYLRTLETDAWGNAVKERRGNSAAMDVTRQYWSEDGRIARICAGSGAGCGLVDEQYAWDTLGNLSAQLKDTRYLEQFGYDRLNRLRSGTLTMQDGVPTNRLVQDVEYDALGNVCRKASAGTVNVYTYAGRSGCGLGGAMNSAFGGGGTGPAGPHQASAVNGVFYYYDAAGNQTVKDAPSATFDRTLGYSLDDKAYEARSGTGVRTRFWYGSDGQRYKREDGAKRTLYLGNVEIVTEAGVTTLRRTVAGVLLQSIVNGVATNRYLFQDQLGSLVRITDAAGAVVDRQDYAAFGARRDYADPGAGSGSAPSVTTRGFTGQEMVDGVLGLIHMNARLYDPGLGRFLQADPVIQAPGNTQSWNAYTYVFNNPYRYTDPTGMWGQQEQGWLRMIAAIVITYFTAGAAAPYFAAGATATQVATGMAIMAAGGFAAGYVASGTLKGGLQGAFTAMLTAGLGVAGANYWEAAGAQALSGGIMESLQGGNFGNGFLSAGLTALAMPTVGGIGNNLARATAGAIVGGTISEATGGKFANGAVSGAVMGAMMGGGASQNGEWTPEDAKARDAAMNVYGDESGGMLGEVGVGYAPTDGFAASLTRPDADGPYYLSYRGSEGSWSNWGNNFGQALGMRTSQYDQAVMLARDVWQATGGNVVFAGHSLGGGLASAAAYATGGRAITFNAAGLGPQYRIGTPGAIRAHYIRGEILTTFQRWTPFPNAAGMPIPHPGRGNPFSRHAIGQFP